MWIAPLVCFMIAQGPTTPLTGTVVGPDGKPVVGAEVILVGLPSYEAPVVARGKSGEGGEFKLERPAGLAGDHHAQRAPILYAVKSGFALASMAFPEALPKGDEPVRLVLGPPGKTRVRVDGPDGGPLAGVKVLPEWLKTKVLPDEVAEVAAATTGADGVAVINTVGTGDLTYVDVHSREFGIQGRPIKPSGDGPAVVALRPVSTFKGRLSAENPEHVRGWRVRAWARTGGGPNAEPQTTGYVDTTTDAEGRFSLAPIAVGGLQLDLKPPGELPVQAELPQRMVVRAGREESVEIPLKRTATVTGRFAERGTGRPVPGIAVTLIYLGESRNGSQTVKTDAEGRYTFRCLPGQVRVGHFTFPPSHVEAPTQGWEDFTVPEAPKVVELATREALPAALPLKGRVVDETGRAVAGATVQGSWMLVGAKGSTGGTVGATTDEQGMFALSGLGPDSTVTITARLRDRQSKGPVKTQAGEKEPVQVAIAPTPLFTVTGRVVGPDGRPLSGIRVNVQKKLPRDNFDGFAETVQFAGYPEIGTAADGTFRSPRELERKTGGYRVEVVADGYLPARSPWSPLPEGDLLTLPDLTLKRSRGVRVVTGKVIDREGKPVPGASVSQSGDGPTWTSAKVGPDGGFRLVGVAGGRALVFAEAPGFRFGGAVAGPGAEPVEIRLAREGEPTIAALRRLPSPLPRAEERALARDLLGPLLPPGMSGTLGIDQGWVISALAMVDPDRVLEMIENRVTVGITQVALGQFEDDPARAIATIEADLNPESRASGWLALEGFRPPIDRALREALLDRALADARKARGPAAKIRLLGAIAGRWLDLGSIEKARPILLEGQGIIASLPRDVWSQEAEDFAEVLAAIDLPAALAIFERQGKTNVSATDPATINRHKGQAALRLAAIDPARAEGLVPPPSDQFYDRPNVVLRVVRAMAKADPDRARKLLGTIHDPAKPSHGTTPALVPFGLGLIADGLAQKDQARAKALLDESFAGLRKLAGEVQGQQSVANLMAELLPAVERVDPGRLAERVWMAAAARGASVQEPNPQEVEQALELAMLMARYDRAVADVIAAPAIGRLPGLLGEEDSHLLYNPIIPAIFKDLAAYDPRAIVPALRALPESARARPAMRNESRPPASAETQLRLAAAQILGLPQDARAIAAGRVGMFNSPYRLGD